MSRWTSLLTCFNKQSELMMAVHDVVAVITYGFDIVVKASNWIYRETFVKRELQELFMSENLAGEKDDWEHDY